MSLIQVSNLTFGYEGSFDNVFENASFSIDTNWRCGFIGRNGRGKTTFLNLLLGKYAYSGTISASVNFEYFPFEVENPDDTPLEIAESIMPDFEMWRLTRELNLLDADPGLLYRPYSTLSYGERTKVLLSILFIRENSFLLIDEPTNHLDIEVRGTLAQYLKSKKGFILVSHDRAFLDEVIDHVLSINRADITVMRGNFTTWQQEKDREDQFELQQNEKLKKDVKRLENTPIPEDFDYAPLNGLRLEAREKLARIRPVSLAQAGRIPGVSPADMAVLSVAMEAANRARRMNNNKARSKEAEE